MVDSPSGDECELLAAVESGQMPLGVYADWLEERGDERAGGVRWLADHDRRPTRRQETEEWANPWFPAWLRGRAQRRAPKDHAALQIPVFDRIVGGWGPITEAGRQRAELSSGEVPSRPLRVLLFETFAEAVHAAADAAQAAIDAGEVE